MCANHIKDISSFFRGANITINARTEDEVEPSVILEKVAKTSATKLCLKERSDPTDLPSRPVGTNYQRIQPQKEINSVERESFWHKQQEEERKRKIEERKRLEEERKKLEEAEKLREMKEAKERENAILKRETELAKRREEEKNAKNESKQDGLREIDEEDPDEERVKRAEAMKRARAQEAKELISGSNIRNARALFEQNTSTGQLSKPPLPKPIRSSINKSSASSPLNTSSNGSTNKVANGNKAAALASAFESNVSNSSSSNETVSIENNSSSNLRNGSVAATAAIFTATAVAGAAATTAVLTSNKCNFNESSNEESPKRAIQVPTMSQKTTTSSIISGNTSLRSEDVNNRNSHTFSSSSLYPTSIVQENHNIMNENVIDNEKHEQVDEEDEEEEENSSYFDDPRVAAALRASQQERMYELPVDHTLEDIAEECEEDDEETNSTPNIHLASNVIPDVRPGGPARVRVRALYDYQAGKFYIYKNEEKSHVLI